MKEVAEIAIHDRFKNVPGVPPLSKSRYEGLREDIKRDGLISPLIVWQGVLVDGHHRYQICQELGIVPTVREMEFESEDHAVLWILRHHRNRRERTMAQRVASVIEEEALLLAIGRAKQAQTLKRGDAMPVLSDADTTEDPHSTRDVQARLAQCGSGTIARARVVRSRAPHLWARTQEASEEEYTINAAYTALQREDREAELASIEVMEAKAAQGIYDVIVMDPPWPMQKIERDVAPNQVAFDYPTMTEEELEAIEVPAADDCHVWVWTTHKFLPMAMRLLKAWDLKYVCTFVWHKPGGFQPFGLPQYNCEFALYARRGSPIFMDTKDFPVCFQAPRKAHSEKPERFYEIVRRVTAGRRLDMFNRRQIEGFDGWGKESA